LLLFWRILPFVAIVPLSSVLDGGSLQRFAGVIISGRVVACNGDHGVQDLFPFVPFLQ
jgi:hypothetical protein